MEGSNFMLNEKIIKLVNEQINKEFFSAYLYLSMSCYYTSKGLNGFANWFKVQEQEERAHALLFMQYALNNSVKVELAELAGPTVDFENFAVPLTAALAHEQFITASINNIYYEAFTLKEFRTMQFLDWFIKEQGEEEKNVEDLIQKYELFGQDSKSLYLLDAELMTRIFTPPSLVL
jgi:ferritin